MKKLSSLSLDSFPLDKSAHLADLVSQFIPDGYNYLDIIEKAFMLKKAPVEYLSKEDRPRAILNAMKDFVVAFVDPSKERKAFRRVIDLIADEKELFDFKEYVLENGSHVRFEPYSYENLYFIRRLAEVI